MGGDAPAPDPLIGQSAQANAELAKESFAFYKDIYKNELLPLQKEQTELGRKLVDRFLATMDKQDQFADEQNQFYKGTFRPVEQKMAQEAMDYDSTDNVNRRMGIAGANVEQAYSQAAQDNARNLSRYGLNPNSSAFAATNERLMRDSALAKAGAQTGAAFDTMDKAIALRAGAANFGRNMPNTAATYYSMAGNSGNQALGAGATGMNSAMAAGNFGGQGFGTAINANNSAGNLMLGDFQGRMQGYQAGQQAVGGLFQGLGTLGGMALGGPMGGMLGKSLFGPPGGRADGGAIHSGPGHVSGPGGPVDDKIPAMLSNGEYVIPADVVKAKGVEFFDKLKAKYHTPAAIQRRQAIGG
jgi:hypothetical protein